MVSNSTDQVLFSVGAIFGYVDYQLEERRAHSAIAASDAVITVFTRAGLDRCCTCVAASSVECCSTPAAHHLVVDDPKFLPTLVIICCGRNRSHPANRAYYCVDHEDPGSSLLSGPMVLMVFGFHSSSISLRPGATGAVHLKRPTENCSRSVVPLYGPPPANKGIL